MTYAIRDTTIDGVKITQGDFLGMIDGKIVISDSDMMATSFATLEKMITEETEIVTIFVGEDGSVHQAEELISYFSF